MHAGDHDLCYNPIVKFSRRFIFFSMRKQDVPMWDRYSITIEEAAGYSLIGENRLRKIIEEDKALNWVLKVGSQVRIKRALFEKWLDGQYNL